jgi:prevent-host-death family protein
METVGAYEAKTRLSSLLDRVERGERINIARHGVPVAVLSPAGRSRPSSVTAAIRALRELRKGQRLDGLRVRDIINEGRP